MQATQTVPWLDSAEWLRVYSALFPPTATADSRRAALDTLLVWKARQPTLVSGVESTLCLLEVQSESSASSERVTRLAYSAALMRFVNHMLDSEQAQGLTLYRAARRAKLPDWLVDIRHSAAHGETLPSLDLLRHGSDVALEWLRRNYWDLQKESISDHVSGSQTSIEDIERRLSRMVSFYASLSICVRADPKIKYLIDIPDHDMRESMLEEAKELLECEFSNVTTVSMKEMIRLITLNLSKLLKLPNASTVIYNTILDENSLFLSTEMLEIFDENLSIENGLKEEYLRSWEVCLTMLHDHGLLAGFVEELARVSADEARPDAVRKLAAMWTREILQAVWMTKIYSERLARLKASNKLQDFVGKKKDHQALFLKLFPNEKIGITLNLCKPIPEELTKLAFVEPIVKSYNKYLNIFIKDLLKFLQPRLSKENEEKLCKLATVISGKVIADSPSKEIYTVNEEQNERDLNSDSDCMEVDISYNYEDERWRLVNSEHDWSKCPLGMLPWQIKSV